MNFAALNRANDTPVLVIGKAATQLKKVKPIRRKIDRFML